MAFPTTLDTFTDPATTDTLASPSHALQHDNTNTAVEAIETKVGVDSSAVATSLDYLLKNTSSSNPGHKHTLVNGATNVTASATELNYSVGVTSAIQTQLGTKAPLASPTFTGTVTMPVALSGIAKLATGVVSAVSAPTGDIVGTSDTQTLTNKRITKRITSITTAANPTINTDNCDVVDITAQGEAIASMTTNLSGTPTNKQLLEFEIKDDGTGRAITWGASYVAGGVALPTTTIASKILTVLFQYSTANALNKWRCIASVQET